MIGFTNGIAVLIALSQVKELLGLRVEAMPADFVGMVRTLGGALHTINPQACALALACLAVIVLWQFGLPRLVPKHPWAARLTVLPGSIVALVLGTLAVSLGALPVETIGSRFGGIPSALPTLQWPEFSLDAMRALLFPAFTLALLGAIESLLCARVADGLIDDRHNANQELMAQGVANFVTPFFGGMPATGTIARTMTNIKSGAVSPIAGMVHALTLLAVVMAAAPLAQNIPLAAMAAILLFVAWNMGEWHKLMHLGQFRLPYRITLLAVFFLTVVADLTVAVEVGLFAACITFIYRISSLSRCEAVVFSDYPALMPHASPSPRGAATECKANVAGYRLYGALFFGAVKLVENLRDRLPGQVLVLDMKNVIYVDSTGADALLDLARACNKTGVQLRISGLQHQPLDIAQRSGLFDLPGSAQQDTDLASCLQRLGHDLLSPAVHMPPQKHS